MTGCVSSRLRADRLYISFGSADSIGGSYSNEGAAALWASAGSVAYPTGACCMNRKRKDDRDFDHMIKVAVYALGAMALMWAFITFVIRHFE